MTEILKPQPGPQEQFLATRADIAIYGGSAGGGKTRSLVMEAARHTNLEKYDAVLFRKTFSEAMNAGGLWDECEEVYTAIGATPKLQLKRFVFDSGATVGIGYLDNATDHLSHKGAQYALIGFDELSDLRENQFWYLLSRNRSLCGIRPYIRATTNPAPDSWVYDLIKWWIDQETGYPLYGRSGFLRWFFRDGNILRWYNDEDEAKAAAPYGVLPKSFTFIPAKLSDNKILEAKDPMYRQNLLALPEVEREQLLNGNWLIKPTAGTVFKPEWFEVVDIVPAGLKTIIGCDLAATKGGGDYTACVVYGTKGDGIFYVLNVFRERLSAHGVKEMLRTLASQYKNALIAIPQDPGQAGKAQKTDISQFLNGYNVRFYPVTGSKITRASGVSAQAEAGNIVLARGTWNKEFLDELRAFPDGAHDDQVDALSLAHQVVPQFTRVLRAVAL